KVNNELALGRGSCLGSSVCHKRERQTRGNERGPKGPLAQHGRRHFEETSHSQAIWSTLKLRGFSEHRTDRFRLRRGKGQRCPPAVIDGCAHDAGLRVSLIRQ